MRLTDKHFESNNGAPDANVPRAFHVGHLQKVGTLRLLRAK